MTFFTNFDNHYNGKTFADVLTSIKSKEPDVKAKLKSVVDDTSGNSNGNDDEVNLLYAEIDKQLTAKGSNPFSAANVESIGSDIDFLKLNFTKAKKNLGKRTAAAPDAKLSSPDVQVEKALYLLNSNDKDEFVPFDGAPAADSSSKPATATKPITDATPLKINGEDTIQIQANTANDTEIGVLTVPEADIKSYELKDNTDKFKIEGDKLKVLDSARLAAGQTYTLTIKATDKEATAKTLEKTITVSIPAASVPPTPANPAPSVAPAEADAAKIEANKNLQTLLKNRGFYTGAIDGTMSTSTKEAIITAQKAYGLTADGIAGAQTIAALETGTPTASAPPATTATKPITPTFAIQINGQETIQVQPNPANDTEVGTLTVPGADVKSYELKDTSGKFKIEGDKLKVKDGSLIVPLDTISLVIKATDKETPPNTLEKTITVSIPAASVPPTPANPAPSVTSAQTDAAKIKANKNLQNLLKDRGFYNGAIDGVVGKTTKDAILAAQKAYGLTADGIAGAKTIAALEGGAPASRVTTTISVEETTRTPTSKAIPPLTVRSNIPDTNRAVLIQSALRKAKDGDTPYYNGLVTGEWDSASNEAYTKWKTNNTDKDINTILPRGSLTVSGKLLGSWSSGADVKTVQTFLNRQESELGIETLEVDGAYGPQTEAAVRALQTKYNQDNPNSKIKEDGILGPETELAINSKYNTNLFNVT